MLQASTKKRAGLMIYAYERWKMAYKHEDLGYMGAFLAQIRQTFSPHFLRNTGKFEMTEEKEKELCTKIYDEINELYTQEHWMMIQADLLEQSFGIFTALHDLTKKKELVWPKEKNPLPKEILEPNKFPIRSMKTVIDKLESVWEVDAHTLLPELERRVGYRLEYKKSTIDHPSANKGIFLKCAKQKYVLPGTLLGFFPGIIADPDIHPPMFTDNEEYPFLYRYDKFWLQYKNTLLPYPVKPGLSLEEYQKYISDYYKTPDRPHKYFYVPPEAINPFALGDKINHPPNSQTPNAILLDFDIPRTFFPDSYLKFMPYIDFQQYSKGSKLHKANCYRTIAVVSNKAIFNDEEIFVDYVYDDRAPVSYTPDWLVLPKERHPLLRKKLYAYDPPLAFQYIHKLNIVSLGDIYEEYYTRIGVRKKEDLLLAKQSNPPAFVGERIRPLLLSK